MGTKQKKAPRAATGTRTRTVLPWKKRTVQKVTAMVTFMERLNEELSRSSVDADDSKSAAVYLNGVLKVLESLDNDWKPVGKKAAGNGALQPGTAVALKDDCAASYSFLPKLAERMVGATIKAVFDKQNVVVQLSDGQQSMFQKRHLVRA